MLRTGLVGAKTPRAGDDRKASEAPGKCADHLRRGSCPELDELSSVSTSAPAEDAEWDASQWMDVADDDAELPRTPESAAEL